MDRSRTSAPTPRMAFSPSGNCVCVTQVRASAADGPLSVARIEGMWSEEGGGRRLPQTRAFQDGVRKKAFKNVVLKCRRFYRPSDTGFPMQQCGTTTAATDIYLSNDIDDTVSVRFLLAPLSFLLCAFSVSRAKTKMIVYLSSL